MKKFLVILVTVAAVTLITGCISEPAYATEVEFGYSESKATIMKNAKYTGSFNQYPWEYDYLASYLETNAGKSYYLNTNADYSFHPYSVFYFGTFNHDTVLDIDKRIDVGVGASWEYLNTYIDREKVSYALIYRDQRLLHSFRYKSVYDGKYLDGETVVFYVTPTNEVRGHYKLGFEVSDNLSVGGQWKFRSTEKTNNNHLLGYFQLKL